MKLKTRKDELVNITIISAFVALSLLLYYVEMFLPPLIPIVPFAKLGLSSIVTLVALYTLGGKKTFIILFTRCLISSLFMGNIFSLVYSLAGAVVSFLVMLILYKLCKKFLSIVAISIFGAITHNLIQVILASLIVKNVYVLTLLPYLLIMSVIAGVITGLCAKFIILKINFKKEIFKTNEMSKLQSE